MNCNVSVKYFSILSNITGKRSEEITIQSGDTVRKLLEILEDRYPDLSRYKPYLRVAVNQEYTEMDYCPADRDEIVFITPVSGG